MKIKLKDKKWVPEDYQKLFWILEHNPHFEQSINEIRKGFKLNNEIADEKVIKLLDDFDLPQNMFRELKVFITDDSMPWILLDPGIELKTLGLTTEVLTQKVSPKGKKREVRIAITRKITRTKLKEWIDENWESILFYMLTLELPDTKIPRWNYLELAKQITDLRDNKNLTFSQIADELKLNDEGNIKTLYHRYKKRLK